MMRSMMAVAMMLWLGVNTVCAQALKAITAGSRQANRLLFDLIQQMHHAQLIRYTQLIAEDNYRWLHLAYVPSDLRGQAIVCQQPTPVTTDEVPAEVTIKDSS